MSVVTDPEKIVKNPLVSVSIITYNHIGFVEDTLKSVLSQKVDFPYEIIIGDDNSNDGTQEILKKYQRLHPDKIQLILHPRDYDDIPGRTNNTTNLYACRGKYVAMLDGDDAWVSEDKLQRQVDFMESHPSYSLSFHDAILQYPNKPSTKYSVRRPILDGSQLNFDQDDLLETGFIQTSSMLFRNEMLGEFPDWFWDISSADLVIQFFLAGNGPVRYHPELFSVRNYHDNSFSSEVTKTDELRRLEIDQIFIIGNHFPKFLEMRYPAITSNYLNLALNNNFSKQSLADFKVATTYWMRYLLQPGKGVGEKARFSKRALTRIASRLFSSRKSNS